MTSKEQNLGFGISVALKSRNTFGGWWTRPALAASAIVLACLVSQFLTIKTQFCYDDWTWLKLARSWHLGQASIFGANPWGTFRPGTHLLWYIDYALFRDRAVGYHIVSLLLYSLNAVAVFALIRRLSGSTRAAFLGALLFATGTATAEAVQASSEQGFLAAGTLAACSLILADKYVSSGKLMLMVGSCLSCVGAMFAHEIAVVVPVGLVLYALLFARTKSMKRFAGVLLIAAVAAALWGTAYWSFYRANGQGILERGEPSLLTTRNIAANMSQAVPALLVPDVHSAALRGKIEAISPRLIGPIDRLSDGLCVVMLLAALLAIVRGSPEVKLGTLWCLAGLAVGSLSELGFAGRYLYVPMVALALTAGPLLDRAFSANKALARKLTMAILAVLILANVGTTAIGLVYRVKFARERYRLIGQIRRMDLPFNSRGRYYIVDLPYKLKDVVDACNYYGIDVVRGDPPSRPDYSHGWYRSVRLRYVAGNVRPCSND